MGKKGYLKTFIIWRLILAAFIPIFIVGFLSYTYLVRKTAESIQIKNELLAQSIAEETRGLLRDPLIILDQLNAFISSHKHHVSEINATLDLSVHHFNLFESIYILDQNGKLSNVGLKEQLIDKRADFIGLDFSNQQFFKKAKTSGQPVWSDIFLSTITGHVSLTLSLPLDDYVLIGNFSIENLHDLTKRTESGEEIITSIVDHNGTLIFHPDKLLVDQLLNMSNIIPVRKALEGKIGTYDYVLDEISYIGSIASIKETGWMVLVSQTADKAYASLYRAKNYFIAGLIISILLVAFLSIMISNSLIHPLTQLRSSSRAFASGKYNSIIPPFDHLELEDLAESFRNMITEVKYREKQLQKSEERYRHLIETMNEGVIVIDTESKVTYCNPKILDLLDYSKDEMIGSYMKNYFNNTNRKILEEQLSLRKKGSTDAYEIQWERKDGNPLITIMSPQPLYDDEGHYNGSFAVITDITDRRKAAQNLAESERHFKETLTKLNMIAIQLDSNGIITFVNDFLQNMSGWDHKEIIGKNWMDLFVPDEIRKDIKQVHKNTINGKIHTSYENEIVLRSGEKRLIKWINSTSLDMQGNIISTTSIGDDITDRRATEKELEKHRNQLEELVEERTARLEERTENLNKSEKALRYLLEDVNEIRADLEKANEKLNELDHLKSMFIASMSHELRTPLNSIIGFTGIILQGIAGEINEQQRDHLERVYSSGHHLLDLISDIMDISKIEAGKMTADTSEFPLDLLIYDAIASLKPQIEKKGLGINITAPPDIQMNTDRKRLLQCILNFLSNAVKFTERGEIVVTVNENNGIIIIKVKDTGIGMKEDDMKRLFGSFVRLESHLKTIAPGTGLGLYLTKKIASEILGGTVYAESIWGTGSTFTIEVPKIL